MRTVLAALALGALAASACGGSEERYVQASSDAICDGICAAATRCDASVQQAECHSSCVQMAWPHEVSEQGAAVLGPCVAGVSCAAIFGDDETWHAELDVCWQEAKKSLEPTQQVRSFCARYAATWFECGAWLSVETCEASFSMWSPEVIDEAAACMYAEGCAELDACLTALFGGS